LNCTFITSYERDDETDLDFAQARYYNKNHGRFTSPDDIFLDQYEHNPQSWNLYTYTRNNPLNFTDPTGEAAMSSQQECPPNCSEEITLPAETVNISRGGLIRKIIEAIFGKSKPKPSPPPQQPKDSWWDSLKKWWRGDKNEPNPQQQQQPQPQQQQQPQTRNPVPNPRANLPSASQRMNNMNGMSRTQVEQELRTNGFVPKNPTPKGHQEWVHPDGSRIWLKNDKTIDRIPSSEAAKGAGYSGRKSGVRIDPESGEIVRPHTFTPEKMQ